MMPARVRSVLCRVLEEYSLPWAGDHGVAHWARVWEIGMRLAEATGADREIVALFAVLHDSRRWDEGTDSAHGQRAADFAYTLRGDLLQLSEPRFELLYRACAGHTHERLHPDVTIQTCWDADRLDLGRVGIRPDPQRLGTAAARRPDLLRWAHERAVAQLVPDLVLSAWGVDLTSE